MNHTTQAREELIAAAHRVMSGRIDDRGPGPHDDAEAEYAEDMLTAAALKMARAQLASRMGDRVPLSREDELARRLAAAYATKATFDRTLPDEALEDLDPDGPLGQLSSFLSALDHALRGTPGCLDPEEWEVGRRANVISYVNGEIAELPPEPPEDASRKIAGVCPMGCGSTLFLTDGGNITCSGVGGSGRDRECPDPTAAASLLSQEAAAQRTEEATVSVTERFKLEAELDAMRKHVSILLRALRKEWWLEAATAYQALHRMAHPPQDAEGEGST